MQLGLAADLYAYTGGRVPVAAQPAIVFLHGAQNDHSVWILQSRWFAHHGYAVYALDLPGHGRSTGPALDSVAAIAQCLAAALTPLPHARLLLVGYSMGTLIALELAARLGERVAGVALLACALPMTVGEALLAATRAAPAEAMQMINVWSHAAGIVPFGRQPGTPGPGFCIPWQNLRLMQRIAGQHGPGTLMTDFAACNAYTGGLAAARALAAPALLIQGSADAMTPPRAARDLVAALRSPTVVMLAGVGHAMMVEAPEAVRGALAEFAHRVAPAAVPGGGFAA